MALSAEIRGQVLVRIEPVRRDPGQSRQTNDDRERYRPDDDLEADGVIPLRVIGRLLVVRPVFECEKDSQDEDRQDNDQHQHGRIDDEIGLLRRDVARRVHYHHVAPRQGQGGHSQHSEAADFST